MANPEDAARGLEQGGNGAIAQVGRGAGIKDGEAGAIESHEAMVCPKPEIAVPGLDDRGDGILLETGVDLPERRSARGGISGRARAS